jgi:hypothetical protein
MGRPPGAESTNTKPFLPGTRAVVAPPLRGSATPVSHLLTGSFYSFPCHVPTRVGLGGPGSDGYVALLLHVT